MPRKMGGSPPPKRQKRYVHFPLLSLPPELISHVFSFLPIKDRLRARVNRTLDKIELGASYSVEYLYILEKDKNYNKRRMIPQNERNLVTMIIDKKKDKVFALRRVLRTMKLKEIDIYLSGNEPHHFDILNLIASTPCERLSSIYSFINNEVTIQDFRNYLSGSLQHSDKHLHRWPLRKNPLDNAINDELFARLVKGRQSISLGPCAKITAKAITKIYKDFLSLATPLREFSIYLLPFKTLVKFLQSIGISFNKGEVASTRNIEAFQRVMGLSQHCYTGYCIFDGNVTIAFTSDARNCNSTILLVTVHEQEEREILKREAATHCTPIQVKSL